MKFYMFWIFVLWMTLDTVISGPVISNAGSHPNKMRPFPCKMYSKQGICMFIQDCAKLNGTHLGICVDGYIFGSCCSTSKNVSHLISLQKPVLDTTNQPSALVTKQPVSTSTTTTTKPSLTTGSIQQTTNFSSSTNTFKVPDTINPNTTLTDNVTSVCGRPKYHYPTGRIAGGIIAQYGKWPWQISLGYMRSGKYAHKCGAVLLNQNWAVTAGHCIKMFLQQQLMLRIGDYDLTNNEEEHLHMDRKVDIVAVHPQFDPISKDNDLALIRFDKPVKFQANIIPICLPERGTDFTGQMAYVTGWGRIYEAGPISPKIRQVAVPVISNSECERMFSLSGSLESIPKIFICAGYANGQHDACEGDSGGPMVLQQGDHWVLGGVTSWGIGCAEVNRPGVYTRISEFLDWINKIIAI